MRRLRALGASPFIEAEAGITQRRALDADRNIGFSATVSARALNVYGSSLSGFSTRAAQAPEHRDKLIADRDWPDDLDLRCRGDVVTRLKVARLADQVGKPLQLLP